MAERVSEYNIKLMLNQVKMSVNCVPHQDISVKCVAPHAFMLLISAPKHRLWVLYAQNIDRVTVVYVFEQKYQKFSTENFNFNAEKNLHYIASASFRNV